MKQALSLGILAAILFAIFVYFQELIGASAFYIAALSMAMFAVIGPFGDYLKTGIAMLIGVAVAMAGIVVLAGKFPLPPDNTAYIALVSGIAIFVLVLLSAIGLRIDAMFIGWAGYNAAVFPVYLTDASLLAEQALPAAVGVSVSLLVGLVLSLIVVRIAMAVNK
ncbi:hypothetical protein [Thermosyntropha sp.]|uniref:DUF1097 family protein n=1 Tax=Thermosyntropha sp. TaxID=2740820 RepID=UPI0025FFD75E|nr:hypothetical protein [Thermosyntropha sp.]MBO8159310.1 hypothetical protein [Thermosyntropha sp.]